MATPLSDERPSLTLVKDAPQPPVCRAGQTASYSPLAKAQASIEQTTEKDSK